VFLGVLYAVFTLEAGTLYRVDSLTGPLRIGGVGIEMPVETIWGPPTQP